MIFLCNNKSKAKNNYTKYAYYLNNSGKSLLDMALTNISIEELSDNYFFNIPQIDWEHIDENQKELWDKGLYDEAVLNEMDLKWDESKTKIIEK